MEHQGPNGEMEAETAEDKSTKGMGNPPSGDTAPTATGQTE